MSAPRVCYLGAYDSTYPRNLILRRGLEACGVEVLECRAPVKAGTRDRAAAIRAAFPALADRCDVILLAEFSATLAPLAWRLARRFGKKLVVDVFTSAYDSAVHDRGTLGKWSPSAWRYRAIDWLSLHLPDLALADTDQHRVYFIESFGAKPNKVQVVPVGASREWLASYPAGHDYPGKTLVQFYGTFIPLHGIQTILDAAAALITRPDIQFELIGKGQTYAAMHEYGESLGLEESVTFREPVPPEELPALAARADVALGIFGRTDKAGRVVPNKVYQTLALGKALISGDTPAIRDAFTPGEHLLTVPPGDPQALAEAITALVDDPARREKLGRAGRSRVEAAYSEKALGLRLLEIIR